MKLKYLLGLTLVAAGCAAAILPGLRSGQCPRKLLQPRVADYIDNCSLGNDPLAPGWSSEECLDAAYLHYCKGCHDAEAVK